MTRAKPATLRRGYDVHALDLSREQAAERVDVAPQPPAPDDDGLAVDTPQEELPGVVVEGVDAQDGLVRPAVTQRRTPAAAPPPGATTSGCPNETRSILTATEPGVSGCPRGRPHFGPGVDRCQNKRADNAVRPLSPVRPDQTREVP